MGECKHAPSNAEKRCPCGVYHYVCEVCGKDCTVGTVDGPATRGLDGKTRCFHCNRRHEAKEARLRNAAPLMLEALRAVERIGETDWGSGSVLLAQVRAAIKAATGGEP